MLEKLLQQQTLLGAVIAEVLGFREAKERGLVQSVKRGVRSDDVVLVFEDGQIGALESKASFRPSSAYLRTSLDKINAQLRAQLQANLGVAAAFAARISLTAHTIEFADAPRNRFLADGLPWSSESEAMD